MMFILSTVSFLLLATATFAQDTAEQYESRMTFYTWSSEGGQMNFTFDNGADFLEMCNNTKNWTIISHAWQENLQKEAWTQDVIDNFLNMRGGCVMFMDYNQYAKMAYATMVTHFTGLVDVVTKKLQQMEDLGFDPGMGFLFGNGFASHLFFAGAYNYSPCTIGRIDACDAAKPQYLNNSEPVKLAKKAAKHVICYHTSKGYGTNLRYCQKSINWGRCGTWQPATVTTGLTNHELCPYFYNNAFTEDFDAVSKSKVDVYYSTICYNQTYAVPISEKIPTGPRMKACLPNGEYYALTSNASPYNVPSH